MPVSLLDIAPPEVTTEEVDIRGTKLVVRGVSNLEYAALLKRFPVLAKSVAGDTRRLTLLAKEKLSAGEALELARLIQEPEDEMFAGMESAPALIAAGLGHPGDAAYEAGVMERLSDAERDQILAVIMRLTVPPKAEDVGPLAPGAGQAAPAASETSSLPL
jgi:hypothetical protein